VANSIDLRELMDMVRAAEQGLESSRRLFDQAASHLAQAICPHRVGDLLEITGESYRGKTGLVKAIRVVPYLGRYEWQCDLVVLKASGQESAHRTQLRQHSHKGVSDVGIGSVGLSASGGFFHASGEPGDAGDTGSAEFGGATFAGGADPRGVAGND
jgi:hypothetical protein